MVSASSVKRLFVFCKYEIILLVLYPAQIVMQIVYDVVQQDFTVGLAVYDVYKGKGMFLQIGEFFLIDIYADAHDAVFYHAA